jgi:hypothetical protein
MTVKKCKLKFETAPGRRGKDGWFYPRCEGGCIKEGQICRLETTFSNGIVYHRCVCKKPGSGQTGPIA